MGVAPSTEDVSSGWLVTHVFRSAPETTVGKDTKNPKFLLTESDIEAFSDVIVAVDMQPVPSDKEKFKELYQAKKEFSFVVYSTRDKDYRMINVKNENGDEPLGISIAYSSIVEIEENIKQILHVDPKGPGERLGLKSNDDYIVQMNTIGKSAGVDDQNKAAKSSKSFNLIVYNVNSRSYRKIFFKPDPEYKGNGMLGCEIGSGLNHQLPMRLISDKKRKDGSHFKIVDPVENSQDKNSNSVVAPPIPFSSNLVLETEEYKQRLQKYQYHFEQARHIENQLKNMLLTKNQPGKSTRPTNEPVESQNQQEISENKETNQGMKENSTELKKAIAENFPNGRPWSDNFDGNFYEQQAKSTGAEKAVDCGQNEPGSHENIIMNTGGHVFVPQTPYGYAPLEHLNGSHAHDPLAFPDYRASNQNNDNLPGSANNAPKRTENDHSDSDDEFMRMDGQPNNAVTFQPTSKFVPDPSKMLKPANFSTPQEHRGVHGEAARQARENAQDSVKESVKANFGSIARSEACDLDSRTLKKTVESEFPWFPNRLCNDDQLAFYPATMN